LGQNLRRQCSGKIDIQIRPIPKIDTERSIS